MVRGAGEIIQALAIEHFVVRFIGPGDSSLSLTGSFAGKEEAAMPDCLACKFWLTLVLSVLNCTPLTFLHHYYSIPARVAIAC
jgi:hypothetical protein